MAFVTTILHHAPWLTGLFFSFPLCYPSALHDSAVFARRGGCDEAHSTPDKFRECMRSKPAHVLLDTMRDWFSPTWPYPANSSFYEFVSDHWGDMAPMAARPDFPLAAPAILFSPVVDGTADGIPQVPLEAIEKGDHNKVPFLSLSMRVSPSRVISYILETHLC